MFVMDVAFGLTVKFSVANESQLVDETKVAVCEPPFANVNPFHVYGNAFWQIVISVVDVAFGLTVKFNVANESQFVDETKVAVCEPAKEKDKPFQTKGKLFWQIVLSVVLVTVGFTVKFSVANESQFEMETKVAVCEPAVANVNPFQLKGNAV
jgi:hypothetical protein